MTLPMRRILVAVADGGARRVTRRVADLASDSGSTIELFSVVRPDSRVLGLPNATLIQLNRAIIDSRRRELESLARVLRRRGLDVTCSVATNASISEGVAKRIREMRADMVAIEAHKHGLLARWFLKQSDYDLIRHCPVPLLIVKGSRRNERAPVLAAVDPWHRNGKPASLDGRIIGAARTLAKLQRAPLHSVHAYEPLMGIVADVSFTPVALPVSVPEDAAQTALIRRRFKALNGTYRIPPRQSHLVLGNPIYVLPTIARSLKAQMVVMGAISRSALDRFLLGSTAESTLDALPCDVLIVKPNRTGGAPRR